MWPLLVLLLGVRIVLAQTCYWPDGSEIASSTDASPCTPAFAASHLGTSSAANTCCPLNWQCLASGVCANPGDGTGAVLYQRTGCVDASFATCPAVCAGTGPSQSSSSSWAHHVAVSHDFKESRADGDQVLARVETKPFFFAVRTRRVVIATDSLGTAAKGR